MERVGIYNRCSTEEESQRNALISQAMESREIAQKKGWEIVEQYIESETGTVAYKRCEYQRLLGDMEKGKFDIIMIKSIDRLTRSAKDWYFFLNCLNENGLRLYIYIEGKFYSPDDNLISGIKAILAEDFSRELSKKIKNAHRRRQEKKSGCNITCGMFGWNKTGRDTYEINEEEAGYYRTAFLLAREGKGFYTISNELYGMGARGRKGQKISETQWRKMLYTPRAHGTVVLNRRVYNFDTKKYENVPERDWVIMENALPPIVSKEYQEEVIRILKDRASKRRPCLQKEGENSKKKEQKSDGKYELTRKLVCGICGKVYYRTRPVKGGNDALWKCASFLAGGRSREEREQGGCDNIHLVESEVWLAVEEALRKHCAVFFEDCGDLPADVRRIAGKVLREGGRDKEYDRLKKEYKKLAAKKDALVDKLLKGVVSDEDYARYGRDIADKMERLEIKISGIKPCLPQYNNYEMRLQGIMEAVWEEGMIEKAKAKELIRRIDHIVVHKDSRLEILFDKDKLECLAKTGSGSVGFGDEESKDYFHAEARYIHVGESSRRREAHKKEILELFLQRQELKLKDIPGLTGMSASYVSARVKELKEEGRLVYIRKGKDGIWQAQS